MTRAYSGNSGSRSALRLAAVAAGEALERAKLQRTLETCRKSWRITIWLVRRGPSFPARNTLFSGPTLLSGASEGQASGVASTSRAPRGAASGAGFLHG